MNELNAIYQKRINNVIEFVDNNLTEPLALKDLAEVACFSSYHFHRIFMSITGETVNNYTNRIRLEKAAKLLKYSRTTIADTVIACGFSSSSTFSRSFKKYFGTTPNSFRKNGKIKNSKICKQLYPMNQQFIPMNIDQLKGDFPVELKALPRRKVAYIRVVDAFIQAKVLKAFQRLTSWAKEVGIYDSETIFGMSLDDPMITPRNKYRYEVCITVPSTMTVNHSVISTMIIPKCKYAVAKVSGSIERVATAWKFLFSEWLVNSTYEPEHLHALEIFLKKNKVLDWAHFNLELCIPVKPLGSFTKKYINH